MRLTGTFLAGFALVAVCGFAQGVAAPTGGFDNFHILTPDPAQTRTWYIKHFGATASPTAGMAYLGKTLVVFLRNANAQPSAGSTIDHLGFSWPDVEAKMKELVADGATVIAPAADAPGPFKAGLIQDPWGVTIEVLNDPAAQGLHHLHLRVRDPRTTLDWFQQMIGGERARLGGTIDGLRYGPMWLLAADSGGERHGAQRRSRHPAHRLAGSGHRRGEGGARQPRAGGRRAAALRGRAVRHPRGSERRTGGNHPAAAAVN